MRAPLAKKFLKHCNRFDCIEKPFGDFFDLLDEIKDRIQLCTFRSHCQRFDIILIKQILYSLDIDPKVSDYEDSFLLIEVRS